jgi:hypothetical protein
MSDRTTGREAKGGGGRNPRWQILLVALLLLGVAAAPAHASMNKTRFFERDGQIVIVSQDVGNQAFTYQWVEHDARRHSDDGLTLYYTIDLTELPPGVSADETEAAIESAVATFNAIQCAQNFELVRVDVDGDTDLGFIQHAVGLGGNPAPRADITFAGWVPNDLFVLTGVAPAFAVALPFAWDANDGSLAWGLDVLDPEGEFSDVNGDGKHDLFATEIYFNIEGNYVTDDPDLANTLFYIDVETIALHELGHALGMDHFGRTEVILDENGNFVDLIVNPNSATLMNTNAYFQNREVSGSDKASFCGLYGNWGKGPRGRQ